MDHTRTGLANLTMGRKHRAASKPTEGLPQLPRQARKTNLTDRKLDDLATKRLTQPVDISDTTTKGLVARVRPNGSRSFYFRWRPASGGAAARKFRSIRLDAANVAEARKKATEAAAAVGIGRDPSVTTAAFNPTNAITVAEAIGLYADYLRAKDNTPNYVKNAERLLRNHLEPALGRHRLIDLTRRDITKLYTSIMSHVSAKAGGEAIHHQPEQAARRRKGRPVDSTRRRVTTLPNRLHTQVAHLLRWATEEEGLLPPGAAPVVRRPIKIEPSEQRLRDGTKRVLRVGHFARIWLAVDDEPVHVRSLVRLLLLIPLRREEMTGLRWPEVKGMAADYNVLTMDPAAFHGPRLDIPKERMKGRKRPQMLPLTELAMDLLRDAEDQRGAFGDHVFSNTVGRTAFAGWESLMARLRRRCPDMPEDWNIHDFRTGIATELGDRFNTELSITQRLLHHTDTARLGVTYRYDLSRRVAPMLGALTAWQDLLLHAVEEERRRRDAAEAGRCAQVIALPAQNDFGTVEARSVSSTCVLTPAAPVVAASPPRLESEAARQGGGQATHPHPAPRAGRRPQTSAPRGAAQPLAVSRPPVSEHVPNSQRHERASRGFRRTEAAWCHQQSHQPASISAPPVRAEPLPEPAASHGDRPPLLARR
jgi:integrase